MYLYTCESRILIRLHHQIVCLHVDERYQDVLPPSLGEDVVEVLLPALAQAQEGAVHQRQEEVVGEALGRRGVDFVGVAQDLARDPCATDEQGQELTPQENLQERTANEKER